VWKSRGWIRPKKHWPFGYANTLLIRFYPAVGIVAVGDGWLRHRSRSKLRSPDFARLKISGGCEAPDLVAVRQPSTLPAFFAEKWGTLASPPPLECVLRKQNLCDDATDSAGQAEAG